jgi:hypothetical protein
MPGAHNPVHARHSLGVVNLRRCGGVRSRRGRVAHLRRSAVPRNARGFPYVYYVLSLREPGRYRPRHIVEALATTGAVCSNVAERNFCSACGTPLTYHRVESGSIAVTIGSLDAPEAVRPIEQFGIESELSWISGLRALPAKRTEDWRREYRIPHIDSHQYSA